jgi:hypothetical protein
MEHTYLDTYGEYSVIEDGEFGYPPFANTG